MTGRRPIARQIVRRAAAGLASAVAIAGAATGARAQGLLTAAEGESAILPVSRGFFTVEFNESKIGVRGYRERNLGQQDSVKVCGAYFPLIRDHRETAGRLAFAAEEGKRALVSSGKLTPGAEISVTFARFWEHGFVIPPPSACPAPKPGEDVEIDTESKGYHALSLTLKGSVVERKTFAQTGTALSLDDGTGAGLAATLAWNYAFRESTVLGVAADAGRDWATPGTADPLSTCVVKAQGSTTDGATGRAEECEDRFAGPLPDANVLKLRADFVTKLLRTRGGEGPSVGLYAAASVSGRDRAKPTYNAALGPMLHPEGKPSQVIGAALVELSDITNAGGTRPRLAQRVFLKLYMGLPL